MHPNGSTSLIIAWLLKLSLQPWTIMPINTGRQQATVSRGANQGKRQYKVVFLKNTKEWVAKPYLRRQAIIERK